RGSADNSVGRGREGRRKLTVIADVVVEASAARCAAGDDGGKARERVRRARGLSLYVVHSVVGKPGEGGAIRESAVHGADAFRAVGEVKGMHAVDADQ